MINELSSQLSRVDSLHKSGKTSTLHFITREVADEEKRSLQSEVELLESSVQEQKRIVATKDHKIRELESSCE